MFIYILIQGRALHCDSIIMQGAQVSWAIIEGYNSETPSEFSNSENFIFCIGVVLKHFPSNDST